MKVFEKDRRNTKKMRSMISYLLLFFMVMFWIFRIIIAFTTSLAIDIGFQPINMNVEIMLLFLTLISIALVGKRMLIGAIVYLISYGMYFGIDLYHVVIQMIEGNTLITDYANTN